RASHSSPTRRSSDLKVTSLQQESVPAQLINLRIEGLRPSLLVFRSPTPCSFSLGHLALTEPDRIHRSLLGTMLSAVLTLLGGDQRAVVLVKCQRIGGVGLRVPVPIRGHRCVRHATIGHDRVASRGRRAVTPRRCRRLGQVLPCIRELGDDVVSTHSLLSRRQQPIMLLDDRSHGLPLDHLERAKTLSFILDGLASIADRFEVLRVVAELLVALLLPRSIDRKTVVYGLR